MELQDFDFLVKPVTTAGLVALGSRVFVNQQIPWKTALWSGAAVGAGVLLADTVYDNFILKDDKARDMGDMIVSAGMGTIAGLGADGLLSGRMPREMGTKTAIILGSIIAADMVEGFVTEEAD